MRLRTSTVVHPLQGHPDPVADGKVTDTDRVDGVAVSVASALAHDAMRPSSFEIRSTSINNFRPFERIEPLFRQERELEAYSRQRNVVERRYFPGFFTVLAGRKQ